MRRLLAPIALMSRHVSSSARITGRINEKVRTGHPAAELAFLQHALWGLDHYPDYLRRWQDKDVQNLENALEAVLAKVRAQRADARRECETMAAKHPKALDALRDAANWRVDERLPRPRRRRDLLGDDQEQVREPADAQHVEVRPRSGVAIVFRRRVRCRNDRRTKIGPEQFERVDVVLWLGQ